MTSTPLNLVNDALNELKAEDIQHLKVSELTDVADTLIICSGTSSRHVKSIAANLVSQAKKAGIPPLGIEGEDEGEWVLVDMGDIIVHILLPKARQFYDLEKLWSTVPLNREVEH